MNKGIEKRLDAQISMWRELISDCGSKPAEHYARGFLSGLVCAKDIIENYEIEDGPKLCKKCGLSWSGASDLCNGCLVDLKRGVK